MTAHRMAKEREQVLKKLFYHSHPFGPTHAEELDDPIVFSYIFEKHNKLYEQAMKRKNPILGRRGSGKTAFLKGLELNGNYGIVIKLQPDEAFQAIVREVNSMSTGVVFVETVSKFWDILFWTTIMQEIMKKRMNLPSKAVRFLKGANISSDMNPYSVISALISIVKSISGLSIFDAVQSLMNDVLIGSVQYRDAKSDTAAYLISNKLQAVVLIDSLEDFQLHMPQMGYAIGGLLKCQAAFNDVRSNAELRFCLPTELYYQVAELSSNPLKDFSNKILLQWHAGELLHLACRRYLLYLSLYHYDEYLKRQRMDFTIRSDAREFWNTYFPNQITNALNCTESSLGYILRHTQLLPRHFLKLLNGISEYNIRLGNTPLRISEQAVVQGIREAEDDICLEIISGFRYTHPFLRDILEKCVRRLPLSFTRQTLDATYNECGKGASGICEFHNFERVMLESGLVGKHTNKVTERYVSAIFEYIMPNKLTFTRDDVFCLHPLVCEIYGAQKWHENSDWNGKCIYPFGSDVEEEDIRELG